MKMFIPFSAIFTLIVLSASVSAKIYHVSIPDQASPGETITATLSSASFIENWDDFGVSHFHLSPRLSTEQLVLNVGKKQVIWGLVREGQGCDGCVGQEIGYQNL